MRRGLGYAIAVLLWLAWAARVDALELNLKGTFTQGGLVIGKTAPGAMVSVGGAPAKVSRDGYFLVGLGRDAPSSVQVQVRSRGQTQVRALTIKKRQYQVQRIDGLPKKQVTPDPAALKRIRADNRKIGAVRAQALDAVDFLSGFHWPVRGRISGVFGSQRILNGQPRRPHNGVDVAAAPGTVIISPADGVVALVHGDMFFTGKTLMIDHGLGLSSVYAHMSQILVRDGQRVVKGTPIGKVGQTGRASGPHLHWGVSLGRTHLDPALLAGPM